MESTYRHHYRPPPQPPAINPYQQDYGPPSQQTLPPYEQEYGQPPPNQVDPYYSEGPLPPNDVDPSPYREEYGPPPQNEMDLPYRQEYGPPPQNEMDRPYRQEYGPPPQNEMDLPYRQEYGPPPQYETDPYWREHNSIPTNEVRQPYQDYGPPPPNDMDPPYGQDYDPPPIDDMDPLFYRQANGPPPPNEMDPPYGQGYGPPQPNDMDPFYGQDYGHPPPNEMDPPYQQEGLSPPNGMDPPYRQGYGPPPPNEMDPPYRQDYGPPPPNEMDPTYGDDYGPPPTDETGQPYGQDYSYPPSNDINDYYGEDRDVPPPNEMDPPTRQGYGPPPPSRHERNSSPSLREYTTQENVMDDDSSTEYRSSLPSSPDVPPNTLEAALKEVEVKLPRLTVIPSTAPAKPRGGECGLSNLGQSCYMNSVLQCLYHIPPLIQYIIARTFKEDIVKGGGHVVRAIADLFTEMDRGKTKKGTLAYFKGVCGRIEELFAGTGQREAHDLLSSLLVWLHQDLATGDPECACTKSTYKARSKNQPASSDKSSNHSDSNHGDPPHNTRNPSQYTPQHLEPTTKHKTFNTKPDNSPLNSGVGKRCQYCGLEAERRSVVSDMFEGVHRANIICPKSGVIICIVHERFWTLSLALLYRGDTPLEEALQEYYRVRAINWYCHYCQRDHLCHRQMRILILPKVLIMHLNRYSKRGADPKLNRVTFPTEELTLTDYLTPGSKGRRKKFSLYGICNHNGSQRRGHYTACCRSHIPHRNLPPWLFFDDGLVRPVQRFKNPREAHILFYVADGE